MVCVSWCVVLLDYACCVYHKGSGSHVQLCPRPCSSTHRRPSLSTHRHRRTTQRCEVRALMPNVAVSPPHVCHRQRTGLSSEARRTSPHLDCSSTEMQNTNCNNFTSRNHVLGASLNACFALSWATSARQCTTETRGQQIGDICSADAHAVGTSL